MQKQRFSMTVIPGGVPCASINQHCFRQKTRDIHTHTHLHNHLGDDVRVHVGRRPAVFEVTLFVHLDFAPDADGRPTVGDTPRERADGGGLVVAGQATLVTLFFMIVCIHGSNVRKEGEKVADSLQPIKTNGGVTECDFGT